MKKLLFLTFPILLLAAACTKQQASFTSQQECESTTGKVCGKSIETDSGGWFATQVEKQQSEQNQQTQTAQPQAQPQAISTGAITDWKTCSNQQFGYTFKFPSDWKFWTAAAPQSVLTTDQKCSSQIVYLSKNLAWGEPSLRVSIGTDAGNRTVEQYFSAGLSFGTTHKPIKESKLDSEQLVWYSDGSNSELEVYAVHEGKLYQILGDNMNEDFLNQILSTFKFTK